MSDARRGIHGRTDPRLSDRGVADGGVHARLDRQELAALTDAMLASGDRLSFDGWATPRIDKHSTGGVGDKVSLVARALVAACGVAVPMIRDGDWATGGTLDKLEAIPGFRTNLSLAEAKAQVQNLAVR